MKKLIITALLVASTTASAGATRAEKAIYTRIRSCVEIAKIEDKPIQAAVFKNKADKFRDHSDKKALDWAMVSYKLGFRTRPKNMTRTQRLDAMKTCNDIIW